MRLLIVGDLHLRSKTPRRRTEKDFEAVCLGKLKQIVKIANEHDVLAAVQVGDFFHSPTPTHGLVAATIKVLQASTVPWYAIHGQHDLVNHAAAAQGRSAIRVLEAALKPEFGVLVRDTDDVTDKLLYNLFGKDGWPTFQAAPFGFDPPAVLDVDRFHVLVSHVMVGDKPLWPGHDLTGPEAYVKKNPGFNLYAIGDFHYPFSVQVGDAWVVNAGCVLRMTADERDRTRRPKVVLFDSETGPEDIYLDVVDEAEAFDLEGYEADKAADARRASFAEMAKE